MKIRSLLFGLALVGCAGAGSGAWVEVVSPIADQVPTVEIRSAGTDAWEMDVSIPGFVIESFDDEGTIYDRVSLPNEMMAGGDGEADLPIISRVIALRSAGDPEIEVVSEEWMELEDTYSLALNEDERGSHKRAAAYSSRNEYLPQVPFGVSQRQVLGGVSLAVVHIPAAKYNPAQGRLKVLRSVQIQVHESGPPISYDRPITETTAGLLRAMVPNWDEIAADVEVVKGTLLYIVASNSIIPPYLEPLVTWRTRKGYTVEVAGPDEIPGSWTTSYIRSYIQDRYNNADPPLEFVCLVGDADGSYSIPAFMRTGFWYGDTGPGDWDYSRLDGYDMLSDVAVGRFCFNSTTELQVLVNKTLVYERDPAPPSGASNPSWFKGAGLLAGNNDWNNSGISTVQLMRWTRERLLENGYTSSSIDTVYYIHETVTAYDINNTINSGISFYCYRGEGYMSDYSSGDMSGLTNGRRMPFMIVITCATNEYDGDSGTSSICEHLVKAGTVSNPKGAIGAVGTSTIETRTRYNNCVSAGIVQGLLREGIHTMGGALSRSRLELAINYPVDSAEAGFFCHISTLLGDPAVDVFTDTPETLFVDNPGSVPVGTNTLTLNVTNGRSQPVADAYVNLVKGDEVFVGDWTDGNGRVILNFATTMADSLFVTATKHNCRPAITHTMVTSSARFVSPASSVFVLDDDDSGESHGDGNEVANPGETIELAVSLRNWGTSSAYGVHAELSGTDPFIASIGDNYEYYGTIASGAEVDPPDDFNFTIADYAPDGHVLQYTLTVTDNTPESWISSVPIVVSNANFEYAKYTLTDVGNSILDPGESGGIWLRLNNVGTRRTEDSTVAVLHSGNPVVTVTDNIGTFDASTPGSNCSNQADPFGIAASSSAIPGDRAPMTCIFPLANGFTDTLRFIVTIGSVAPTFPSPPDAYGYWAFDNADITFDKHPTYDWVEIDTRYGGSGTQLNINDYSYEDDATRVVTLPFTFRYYGQEFTQISVCSNGWIAMGADQVQQTGFRNWHIPAALGPEGMIAPFWDDLYRISYNGSYGRIYYDHDTANHRFIIEWSRVRKYNGSSNPTLTFECILYEPGYPVTPTGDGEILFQYHTCTNTIDESDWWPTSNDYATVGIENLDESDGVLYSYFNLTSPFIPGASSMTSGKAILFTTQKALTTAPKAPANLIAYRSGDDIELHWNAVHEDIYENPITVDEYNIYRDLSASFAPDAGTYLATTSDTTYQDVGAAGDAKYFYVVQASLSGSLSPFDGVKRQPARHH